MAVFNRRFLVAVFVWRFLVRNLYGRFLVAVFGGGSVQR